TQVSGRAGRHELSGEVIIQSYTPEHYSIEFAASYDYSSFYAREMKLRKQHDYLPYYFLALVTISDFDVMSLADIAEKISAHLKKKLSDRVVVLGPVAAVIPRIKDRYRYQCVVKYKRESNVRHMLARIAEHYGKQGNQGNVKVSIDMHPQRLM